MKSTYPFDPTDWKTITPLFMTLIEAPLPDGGFMDWLEQWKQLDIAVWDAYTALKLPTYYDTSDHNAERLYQAYVQELYSTYLGLTNALVNRALTLQPTPPTADYEQLWRRWRNQATLFQPASLPIQAEISQLEGRYREIMRKFEADKPVAYWLDRRGELNELMLRLLHLRRTLARTSGMPTFLEYRWRELNRLDYTIADCQAFHRAIETLVVPAIIQFRANDGAKQPPPEVSDLTLLGDGVERILQQIDPSFGALFHALRDTYLDLGNRPNKASAVEEWFLPRPAMPYLHVASTNLGSILHESGHGLHDYLSFQAHQSMWNLGGPEEFQEFAATSIDLLGWPYYAQSEGGPYSAEESAVAHQNVLRYYFDALANCALQDAFEHWVYGVAPENVTPADFDAKWLELKQRFTPWDDKAASADEAMTGWQRWSWSLFRMPFYMITYPMAIVGTCQFGRLVAADRSSAINNYKAALALGNTQPLSELFRRVGIRFPFTKQDVEETVQFVIERF